MTNDAQQAAPESAQDKPERNPTEKLIVRILIIAMLILVVVEAHAKIGYSSTLSKLEERLKLDDQGEPLSTDTIPSLISGFPSRTEHENKSFTYRWKSFVKSYGITVDYDNEHHVTALQTDLPPEIPVKEFAGGEEPGQGEDAVSEPAGNPAEGTGSGNGSGPGDGTGRRRGNRPDVERPSDNDPATPDAEAPPVEATPATTENPVPVEEPLPEPPAN